jgi:hypothetical protein
MKESSTGMISLEDDDPDSIESMLRFCYGINYLEKNEKYASNEPLCKSLLSLTSLSESLASVLDYLVSNRKQHYHNMLFAKSYHGYICKNTFYFEILP